MPYSCAQMYQLVNQIEAYPTFLNWCSQSSILKQTDTIITASIKIDKGILNQSFTTINTLTPNQRIDIRLKEGPFNHLTGAWIFTPLGGKACKISFQLEFSFASKLTKMAIAPIFIPIANSQLNAFVARAKQIYSHD